MKKTLLDASFVLDTLQKAGFIVNIDKSIFIPVQCLEWLGYIWDLMKGCLKIPDRRIVSAKSCIESVLGDYPQCTARKLAQLSGKIISMAPVLGNVCLLQTKIFFRHIESRSHWDGKIDISDCFDTLQFWSRCFSKVLSKPFFQGPLPEVIVYSDASAVAGAAFIECDNVVSHKTWSEFERSQSSTYRELLAIDFALSSFKSKLAGKHVVWYTDSKNCVNIIQKGSMNTDLQEMAFSIFHNCISNCISLQPKWIGRHDNSTADELSRVIDYDDYGVSTEFFHFIDSMYGPHTIDRFANEYNTKLSRYNSLFSTPCTEAVDAFSVSWHSENNWLVPPICLIPKCLNFLLACRAVGTLVVPFWPSSPFYPMLFGANASFAKFVVEVLLFKSPKGIYIQGHNKETIFGSDKFTSKVLVVRLNCS